MAYFELSDEYYCRTYMEGNKNGLDDTTIVFILQLIQAAGYEKSVFYDREDSWSVLEFVQWAKGEDKLFYVLYKKDGTPISIAWFNGFSSLGHQAFSHFSTLRTAPPEESLQAGRLLLELLKNITKIKQFIGITPKVYRHAVNFAYGLGFKRLTVLKNYAMCMGKERDCVLSIYE